MAMHIALIACSKQKLAHPAPARDWYAASALFRLARAYAEQHADAWLVLSAQHGLVTPERVIEPYNHTMREKSSVSRGIWAGIVLRDIQMAVPDPRTTVVFLAGYRYREHLEWLLRTAGYSVETPLAGLGIGQQMAWLKERQEVKREATE